MDIYISILYLSEDFCYTSKVLNEIKIQYKNKMNFCYPINEGILFSNTKIKMNEVKILEKLINDNKSFDMLMSDGITTAYATYKIV